MRQLCVPKASTLRNESAKGNPTNVQTSDQCKYPQLTKQKWMSHFNYFYILYAAYKVETGVRILSRLSLKIHFKTVFFSFLFGFE